MATISPKNVIVDFLRKNLTDARSRAESSNTEEFNGGGTDFTLTPPSGKISAITGVTVDGVSQNKWKDYRIDFQNEKVIFFSATASGTDNVDITYKHGTSNWIYPDKPLTTLSKTSFPRLNILIVDGTGARIGQYNSDVQTIISFQIDVWAKEDYVATIDNVKYAGDKLAEYIGLKVIEAFRSSIDELHPVLYNYRPGHLQDLAFDKDLQVHHKIFQMELNAINVGEI
jgi:hypothetical protein